MTTDTTHTPDAPTGDAVEPVDATEAPDTAPDPTDAPEADTTPDEHDDGGDDLDPARLSRKLDKVQREARNLRTRLQTAETERDTARAAVDNLTRLRAEHIAADMGLLDPEDLWRHGTNPDDLTADGHGLDPERVKTAVEQITAERPHLRAPAWNRRPAPHLDYQRRMAYGVEPAVDAPASEWADYRLARARLARGGATPANLNPEPEPTWGDALAPLRKR